MADTKIIRNWGYMGPTTPNRRYDTTVGQLMNGFPVGILQLWAHLPFFPGNVSNPSVISESRYLEFVEMGLLSAENLRKTGSTASSLSEINTELSNGLTSSVMEYIEEANHRLKCYEESKAQLDKEIQKMKSELDCLKVEREKLGFFAFSKKKELDLAIDSQTKQMTEYEKTHESKKLKDSFERMYS